MIPAVDRLQAHRVRDRRAAARWALGQTVANTYGSATAGVSGDSWISFTETIVPIFTAGSTIGEPHVPPAEQNIFTGTDPFADVGLPNDLGQQIGRPGGLA